LSGIALPHITVSALRAVQGIVSFGERRFQIKNIRFEFLFLFLFEA
jgi:hypothetical protein